MRNICFRNSSAAALTQSWIADSDCSIVAFYGPQSILSDDPSLTVALETAPTATEVKECLQVSGAAFFQNLDIPLAKGTKIFVSHAAKETTYLVVEP